jgi:tetratricopeptide (TPR) repeat protein
MTLAEAYRHNNQYRAAAAVFEQASTRLASLGRDDTQTAGTLFNNWALTLWAMGRPLDAEKLFRRAIAVSSSGANEQSVSPMLLVNEARTLRGLARFKEAADYAGRAYAIAKHAGDEVVVTQSLIVLGSINNALGNSAQAAAAMTEVESRLRQKFPNGHEAFSVVAIERSFIAELRGDLEGAMNLANEAVRIVEASSRSGRGGKDYLAFLLVRRSAIEIQLRRIDEAVADATRALTIAQESTEPGVFSSALGRAYLALGRARHAQGNREEARTALRSAAEHLEKAVGPDHPDTLSARQLLSALEG